MMQIFIFFMLGLLGRPANLAAMFVPAVLIFLFLTLVARPLAVAGVLSPMGGFRKYPLRQQALVSFVGLRGAASIVFAIGVLASGIPTGHDIFSIVFAIVLISIALQGSLIPQVAKSLDMIDKDADVMKTFSDYSDSAEINFGTAYISETSQWKDRSIKEIKMPQGLLVAMILRGGEEIIPDGDTVFRAGDEIVFCTRTFNRKKEPATLIEHPLPHNSKWDGRIVKEYPKREDSLLVMIRRGDEVIVPKGHTELKGGDVLVMLKR
jgi:cell volume regulation protein A